MARATLQTVLTGDESPFVQAVNRAEKRAQSFQGRIQTLFRRDPSARAQRALGGFVGDLASGDVGTAISSIATRLHGVGLAAGIGIGAAVIIFQKAKSELDAVDKAVEKVNANLARPLNLRAALGAEGLSKEIETATKDLDALKEKRKGFFQTIREGAERGKPDEGYFDPNTRKWVETPVDRMPSAVRAQAAGEKDLRAMLSKRADAELRVVGIRRMGLEDSERESDLAEVGLKSEKKRAELMLEYFARARKGAGVSDIFKRMSAVNQDEELSRREVGKRFDLKKQEEEVENRILNLHASTLTKDQQSVVALRERISLLKRQLTSPGSAEEKARVGTRLHGLENQEAMARYQEYLKPQAQKDAEREAQRAYQRWVEKDTEDQGLVGVHRDIHNRLIGGMDPITGEYKNVPQPSYLHDPNRMKSAFSDHDWSLGDHGHVGDTRTDSKFKGASSDDAVVNKLDAILTAVNSPAWVNK